MGATIRRPRKVQSFKLLYLRLKTAASSTSARQKTRLCNRYRYSTFVKTRRRKSHAALVRTHSHGHYSRIVITGFCDVERFECLEGVARENRRGITRGRMTSGEQ